jgi:hypothetical protein
MSASDYNVNYEVYALVSGERVTLHSTPDRRMANKLLADEHRLLKQGRYAPEVTDVGLFIPDWKVTDRCAHYEGKAQLMCEAGMQEL